MKSNRTPLSSSRSGTSMEEAIVRASGRTPAIVRIRAIAPEDGRVPADITGDAEEQSRPAPHSASSEQPRPQLGQDPPRLPACAGTTPTAAAAAAFGITARN